MLKAIKLICFVALLMGLGTDSWSKPPSPSPTEASQNPENPTKPTDKPTSKEERGTENLPIFIKILPTSEAQTKPDETANNQQDDSPSDWWLVVPTISIAVIAAIQTLVFGWQGIQLKRTVEATHRSERPYLFPTPPLAGLIPPSPNKFPSIDYAFQNHGKTPAITAELRVEIILAKQLPRKPVFTHSEKQIGSTILDATFKTLPRTTNFNSNLTEAETQEVIAGTQSFFFFGYAKYTDIFGFTHTDGFGLRYRFDQKAFTTEGVPTSYKYWKTEKT